MALDRGKSLRCLVGLLVLCAAWTVVARPVVAQAPSAVTVEIIASVAKAKVGQVFVLRVAVTNRTNETIPNVVVSVNNPDAINAGVVSCPEPPSVDNACEIGDLKSGERMTVVFSEQPIQREPNGPIQVFVFNDSGVLAFITGPTIKIVGSNKFHAR